MKKLILPILAILFFTVTFISCGGSTSNSKTKDDTIRTPSAKPNDGKMYDQQKRDDTIRQ